MTPHPIGVLLAGDQECRKESDGNRLEGEGKIAKS
jgi:hypothetical protein